jgi:LmbE family N-acetylglucosaminyl deacetylase
VEVLKRLHEALDTADLSGLDSHLGEFANAVSWAISRLQPEVVCVWNHFDHGRCVRLKDHDGRCEYADGTFSEKERVEIEAEFYQARRAIAPE